MLPLLLLGHLVMAQQGLKVEYYDGVNFDRLEKVSYVANIDQSWNNRPPVPGINPHYCSIRWTGKLKPGKSGTYKFSARVDDGIRVWVGNRLIIDQWDLHDVGIFQGSVDLEANQMYDLKVEYFNALIEGEVRLLWKIPTEEKSWYEYLFGDDKSFTVIAPQYFYRPETPNQREEKTSLDKPAPVKNDSPPPKPQKRTTSEKKPEPEKTVVTVKEAQKFIPKNIEFERSKTIILQSSYEALNTFAQFMLDNPGLTVMIEGHTDPVGDANSNLQLSKRRAATVARYLIEKGVDHSRIEAEGYGGSRPLKVPEKGTYYPANRRVVFILDGLEEEE